MKSLFPSLLGGVFLCLAACSTTAPRTQKNVVLQEKQHHCTAGTSVDDLVEDIADGDKDKFYQLYGSGDPTTF